MSGKPSRLVGAMWWILIVTPAISLAIQISTGYLAHSPDEAGRGFAPDDLLFLLALLLVIPILGRLVFLWRRLEPRARAESIATVVAVIPLVVVLYAIAELVGWPRTRTASALQFAAAGLIVLAWTVALLLARQRLRFQGVRVVEPR